MNQSKKLNFYKQGIEKELQNLDKRLVRFQNIDLDKKITVSCNGQKVQMSTKDYIFCYYQVFNRLHYENIFDSLKSLNDTIEFETTFFPHIYTISDHNLDSFYYVRRENTILKATDMVPYFIYIDYRRCSDNITDYKIFHSLYSIIRKNIIDKESDKNYRYLVEPISLKSAENRHKLALIIEYGKREDELTFCLFNPHGICPRNIFVVKFLQLLREYIYSVNEKIKVNILYDEDISEKMGIQIHVKTKLCVMFSYLWLYIFANIKNRQFLSVKDWINLLADGISKHVRKQPYPVKYMYIFSEYIIEKILLNLKHRDYYLLPLDEEKNMISYFSKFTDRVTNESKDHHGRLEKHKLSNVIEYYFCQIMEKNIQDTQSINTPKYCETKYHCDPPYSCIDNMCLYAPLTKFSFKLYKDENIVDDYVDLYDYYLGIKEYFKSNNRISFVDLDVVNDQIVIYAKNSLIENNGTITLQNGLKLVMISKTELNPDIREEKDEYFYDMVPEIKKERLLADILVPSLQYIDYDSYLFNLQNKDPKRYLQQLKETDYLQYLYEEDNKEEFLDGLENLKITNYNNYLDRLKKLKIKDYNHYMDILEIIDYDMYKQETEKPEEIEEWEDSDQELEDLENREYYP